MNDIFGKPSKKKNASFKLPNTREQKRHKLQKMGIVAVKKRPKLKPKASSPQDSISKESIVIPEASEVSKLVKKKRKRTAESARGSSLSRHDSKDSTVGRSNPLVKKRKAATPDRKASLLSKHERDTDDDQEDEEAARRQADIDKTVTMVQREISRNHNVYLEVYNKIQAAMPSDMDRLLDPTLPDSRRAELFDQLDPDMPAKYSWAVPDERALRILTAFAPIVEIGAARGYWGGLLLARGVRYVGFDQFVDPKRIRHVSKGGPEELARFPKHSLFLCYPDDFKMDGRSLAVECLKRYKGDTIIHVGEIFGHTFLENPWGKTTDADFQEELAATFHQILQVPLPSWQGACDTLTVWKRTQRCQVDDICFQYIPKSEMLDLVQSCPATKHLV